MTRRYATLITAILLLFPGCADTVSCRSRITGEAVRAERVASVDGTLRYSDSNGISQRIDAANSDQWQCVR